MEMTPEQRRAVDRRDGPLFVTAGAGGGKTRVLVERFVAAAREDDVAVDRILAITFTEKAAAEMKVRVRTRFIEMGDRGRARETERAWVSTIHGFCARVLRAHALAAGLDPEFHVLDEAEAGRLQREATELALEQFLGGDPPDPDRLELLAAYGPDPLGGLVRHFYARRRSRGDLRPRLEPPPADGRDQREIDQCGLLGVLIELYGERYAELKAGRSGLDFEDLELATRDLLRDQPAIRDRYRGRFEHVLVDELQDVNPLQDELLELIADGNIFTVGDELQSIYGFRHADVGVFRARRATAEAAGRVESLTANFRTRREVLDVVDAAFADAFGDGFQPLVAHADRGPAPAGPAVDLLVVDKTRKGWDELPEGGFGDSLGTMTTWRAAEARMLARRIEEIVAAGPHGYGDVVILLRAATDALGYERALGERGIPTYLAGGGGYWSQQQVADLRAYLAALANPLDELALYSVLASPLGGLSLEAVVAIGLRAKGARMPAWRALQEDESVLEGLNGPDREAAERFVRRFAAERRAAPRLSLEALIDRFVTDSGYDLAVLAMPGGERRMANVRKLMRLARLFEADEGRDLRGFIDFVDEQDLIRPREGQAPLEGEGIGAVRLMTIHMAKGLEFPVVCVADLGRGGQEDNALLDVAEDGRVALKMASLDEGYVESQDRPAVREEQKELGDAEERRVFYVGMTRAQDHLVLSGAADVGKWPEPKLLGTPMDWIWRAVAPDLAERFAAGEHSGESSREWDGRATRVGWSVCAASCVDDVLPAADRVPAVAAAPGEEEEAAGERPAFEPVPSPGALPVARLSYSALASYERCGYRFHLERGAGRRPLVAARPPPPPLPVEEPGGQFVLAADPAPRPVEEPEAPLELTGLARGSLVHELLERLDMRRPELPPDEEIAELITAYEGTPDEASLADVRRLVEAFVASPVRERMAAAAKVRREVPFAFNLEAGSGARPLLVTGFLDAHVQEEDGVLVVDYKTDPLEGRAPAEVWGERYAVQRTIYALACLLAGAPRVEVAYCFLEDPSNLVTAVFSDADVPALRADLNNLAGGVVDGRFEPTDHPHRDLCLTCPGRPALCSWPPERTLAAA